MFFLRHILFSDIIFQTHFNFGFTLSKFTLVHTSVVSYFINDDFWFIYNKTFIYEGWMAVICQRDAVKLWPQFSALTPLVWESWTWVTMICRIQEWSSSLLDCGVHTVHWKLSGQFNFFYVQTIKPHVMIWEDVYPIKKNAT